LASLTGGTRNDVKSLVAVTARGNAYTSGTGSEYTDLREPYLRGISRRSALTTCTSFMRR
jgi:hypothetical protein